MFRTRTGALVSLGLAALLLLLAVGRFPAVTGHEGEFFNVNLRQDKLQPETARINQYDLVRWRNLDGEANHTVYRDVNNDGDYNDTGEWRSGNLSYDETFTVFFNASIYPPGNYAYTDEAADGTRLTGVVVVQSDAHGQDRPALIRVYEDYFHPNNLTLSENSTLRWEVARGEANATANLTHAIARDANDDGDYNDTGEWDSGPLSAGDSFNLTLNGAEFPPGVYEYVDYLANGSQVKGIFIIAADDHDDESPDENPQDRKPPENDNDEDDADRPVWLLALAVSAGAGAAVMALAAVMKGRWQR